MNGIWLALIPRKARGPKPLVSFSGWQTEAAPRQWQHVVEKTITILLSRLRGFHIAILSASSNVI